jgi:hypothetical protein
LRRILLLRGGDDNTTHHTQTDRDRTYHLLHGISP